MFLPDYIQRAIPDKPVIAYGRAKNLRDLLVHAQPSFLLPASGSTPCRSSHCLTCQHIWTGTTVQSLIYMAICVTCSNWWDSKCRLSNDIKHKRIDKLVAGHFNEPGHSVTNIYIYCHILCTYFSRFFMYLFFVVVVVHFCPFVVVIVSQFPFPLSSELSHWYPVHSIHLTLSPLWSLLYTPEEDWEVKTLCIILFVNLTKI